MLSLITNLHDEKDLTIKLIEKKLGIPFKAPQVGRHSYYYGKKLNEHWVLSSRASPYPDNDVPWVVLSVEYLKEDYPYTIGEVCIDLDHFNKTLIRHGFRQSYDIRTVADTIYYVSKDGRTHVDTSFDVEKLNGKNHECLTSIELNIANDRPILEEFKDLP